SPTAAVASSPAGCRRPGPSPWCAGRTAPPAPISPMCRTPWPISASWASTIARSKRWRARLPSAPRRAVGEDRAGQEAEILAGLLDRATETVAQHDPAVRRMRKGQRIAHPLARLRRQGRELTVEAVGEVHAVGRVQRHHEVRRLGRTPLQVLDEDPHGKQALAPLAALVDDQSDA